MVGTMTRVRLDAGAGDFADLRDELGISDAFPPEVLAEVSALTPDLAGHTDATDVPFVTIDPEGSRDLDQAVHLAREGRGFRVRYAIADVGAFVRLGGAIDTEARQRGQTLYLPDERVPLHPPTLSEGAASLLPDQDTPAVLWDLHLSADGEITDRAVTRAIVRSRAQLTYDGVQAELDGGAAGEQTLLLREVGRLREQRAAERGAVDLPSLEQRVDTVDGTPVLTYRAPSPTEGWNAQISLLTGGVAAQLMLDGKVGVLRTMPDVPDAAVASLRRGLLALGVAWPQGASYGKVVSGLDPYDSADAAALVLATRLLRGAGYTAFDGALPELTTHSAVGGPYAHATAPLRRLVDRFVSLTCLSLYAGQAVGDGVREALPLLPDLMEASDRRAGEVEREAVNLAESLVLAPRVGEVFDAVVVDTGPKRSTVQLRDPAVRARCSTPDLPLGEPVRVRLTAADPATRTVDFVLA